MPFDRLFDLHFFRFNASTARHRWAPDSLGKLITLGFFGDFLEF